MTSMDKWNRTRKPYYVYSTPRIAVGAAKLLFDLFVASTALNVLELMGLYAKPQLDTAVAGVVSVRADLYRTSAIGTGGTGASRSSGTIDVAGGNICKWDEAQPDDLLDAGVTARVAPTGGATISRWLFGWDTMPEETNAAAYLLLGRNLLPRPLGEAGGLIVRPGTGILVKQGAVASVGAVGYTLVFGVSQSA
jgi:hypothetical protein